MYFENWKVYIDLVSNSENNYSASLCIINNCSLFLPTLGPAAWMSISDVKKNHVQLFLLFFPRIFQGKSNELKCHKNHLLYFHFQKRQISEFNKEATLFCCCLLKKKNAFDMVTVVYDLSSSAVSVERLHLIPWSRLQCADCEHTKPCICSHAE